MRPPFPYEQDASLLGRICVPDLVQPDEWAALIASRPAEYPLIQWLCEGQPERREALIALLLDAAGHPKVVPWQGEDSHVVGAEATILRANGFTLLGPNRMCGGPSLPPDLFALLGPASQHWEWCLVSPFDAPPSRSLNAGPGSPAQAADTAHGQGTADHGPEALLWEALSQGARDIHFERHGPELVVRFHTGKRMIRLGKWGSPFTERWLRMLKQMSGLHPDGQVLPEDGRLELGRKDGRVSMRVGRVPTLDGESLVLRLAGDSGILPSLGSLGMPPSLQWTLTDAVAHDPGLILFCGVTGSGKTTSACALLREITRYNLKIVTIEDPLEYILPGVQQSSVDAEAGWTFSAALRAYLRQDPDVILIGEIRDADSAQMACRAALTGHCVLATLHAGNIPAAMDRLSAWQISPALLTETVRLVVHQHLAFPEEARSPQACFSWETAPPWCRVRPAAHPS